MTEAKSTPAERRSELHRASELARRRTRTLVLALIFGALGPALCFGLALSLELDPFGRFSVALHTAAGSGILLLFVQVSGRTRAPRASALLSGGLASSALHALLAGVLLLPFSMVLLISVIGLLGFIPFGTAWSPAPRFLWTPRSNPFSWSQEVSR